MRIAQIAPIIERVPPKKYGGSERVIYHLTEELVKKGHQVTLFASGDSVTSANLVSVYPTSLREAKIASTANGADGWSLLNIGLAYKMQKQFDIIHDHSHIVGLPTANLASTPVVVTLHDPIFDSYKPILETFTNPYVVTISQAQAEPAPGMNHIGTVHHGMKMDHYPYADSHKGYLLWVGNFRPEKGADRAIAIAKRTNLPLIMAGKLDKSWQMEYFTSFIKPHLSNKIRFIGEVNEEERNKLMSHAMAFLHPISWREPFGLTLIESMACGTPVIAFNQGSSPEIIKHGQTGYVVNSISEAVLAVKRIGNISREACRQYVLKTFNAERMADDYETIYLKILDAEYRAVTKKYDSSINTRAEYSPLRKPISKTTH